MAIKKKNIKSKKTKPKRKVSSKAVKSRKKPSAKISKRKSYAAKRPKDLLKKSKENPIIAPKEENNWEAWQTFNPGVILLDDKIHFLYRAIGQDGISRLGYAMSNDGFNIDERLPYPVFEHELKERVFSIFSYFSGGSWGGCEDPRIVRVEREDTLYMTYTAVGDGELRVALTSIKVNDFLEKKWKWKSPVLISPPGQVHKNWVIFPEKIKGKFAILHSISPNILVDCFDSLDFDNKKFIESYYTPEPIENGWESYCRGAGPPPIKTEYGWLLFYHAIDKNDYGRYKAGAMLLDLEDPTKVLLRSKMPVLEPTELYENNGYKAGVVYVSGAVNKNGELLIYYGGADSSVCVASADLKEFLESLRKQIKPRLVKQKLKKNK